MHFTLTLKECIFFKKKNVYPNYPVSNDCMALAERSGGSTEHKHRATKAVT